MKKKFNLILILLFFCFCFFVFFQALNNSNVYIPNNISGKVLSDFKGIKLENKEIVNSEDLFSGNDYYLLNIWASWCLPCRKEHSILMEIKDNNKIKLIGINYKDNELNAKKFLIKNGNPFSEIIQDKDGMISINLGAYGVPETYLINKKRKIIKKFVGQLNKNSIKEIKLLLK